MEKNLKNNQPNIFVRWWKLTNPHKGYFAGQIISFIVYTVFLSLITIFAAKTINFMYAGDWNNAFLYLILELMTIVIRNLALHIEYIFYTKTVAHIRYGVTKKVYNKILSCKSEDFNVVSQEKVKNIAVNNTGYLSEFPDSVASFIAHTAQVVFILVTVFISNYLAGIIITCLGVVNFFAYYFLNNKLGRIMLERYEKTDDMFKSYSKVINGKTVINELHGKDKYEGELTKNIKDFNNAYSRYYMVHSYKVNLYFIFWNVVVYAIACLMMFFVSKGSLDIATYLIIVPYLTTCTTQLNGLFDKTNSIENMRVDVDRINLILNMNDQELIAYGNINKESQGYNLGFVDVSYNMSSDFEFELKNANLNFEMNKINVIKGEKGGGKRIIFNMLRRYIKPDSGKIVLDNLDLYDYNESTYKNHIDYCASHPSFVVGTIKENLMLVDKNLDNIKQICSELGVLRAIEKMPKGFDTEITEVKSSLVYFMLGLARALLSKCKVLMVYELPQDVPDSSRQKIVDFLKKINTEKTIILFTHSNDYDEIANVVYQVNKGEVKKYQK